MAIDPLQTSNAAAAAAPRSSAAQASLSADYDSFLKLLTAQVSNQDPLEPMDSTTFVSQLAQLSQVEQSIQTNATLEEIGARLAGFGALSEAGLIGRTVRAPGDTFRISEGGNADLTFALKTGAQTTSATILHPDGTEVQTYHGLSGRAGETQTVRWNGTDYNGLPLPAGEYRIRIDATDAEGKRVGYETFTEGEVDSVLFRDGAAMLRLGTGAEIASDRVVEIR